MTAIHQLIHILLKPPVKGKLTLTWDLAVLEIPVSGKILLESNQFSTRENKIYDAEVKVPLISASRVAILSSMFTVPSVKITIKIRQTSNSPPPPAF